MFWLPVADFPIIENNLSLLFVVSINECQGQRRCRKVDWQIIDYLSKYSLCGHYTQVVTVECFYPPSKSYHTCAALKTANRCYPTVCNNALNAVRHWIVDGVPLSTLSGALENLSETAAIVATPRRQTVVGAGA